MIRRNLLIVTAVVVSFVLTACSDMTAPKNETCPIVSGLQTCIN
jgi:outer membrane biogenesis lipoprotein LolB